jgi:glycosyltransferase involved in cell wall biosynthesis
MAEARPAIAVSVVTPTFDRLRLLLQAMDSVAAQTLASWEHIVVDDGSTDGTAEEVRARAALDPRIRYVVRTGERRGANVCRNLGLAASRGAYVVFLDSDDLLLPECLARRCEIMARNADVDFATFQTSVFVETPGDLGRVYDYQLLGDDLLRFLTFDCPWIITGPIWRKSALDRLGGFDEALPSWQDVDLHIRAIASGLRYLRFPHVDHHVRWQWEATKISIEQRRSPRHLRSADETLVKFEKAVRSGPGMNWVRQRALCSLYFFVAEQWVALGELRSALDAWRRIRQRSLGTRVLHVTGALLLALQAVDRKDRRLSARLTHKWKGWMRMRTNPELVSDETSDRVRRRADAPGATTTVHLQSTRRPT